MSIIERFNKQAAEARVLKSFFKVDDAELDKRMGLFRTLIDAKCEVSAEEFEKLLNKIDARLEDVCLRYRISQEYMDELVEQEALPEHHG